MEPSSIRPPSRFWSDCRRWTNGRGAIRPHWPRVRAAGQLRKSSTATNVAALNWCFSIGSGLARIMSIIQPRIVLRLIRGLVIEHRIPCQSVRPFWGAIAFSPSCFSGDREERGGRISGAIGTVQRRQDISGSPVAIQALDRACSSPCRPVGA